MSRQELFAYITKHNLKEEVKKTFGDNHTRVKTVLLEKFVETDMLAREQNAQKKEAPKKESTEAVVLNPDTTNVYKAGVVVLLSYLKQLGVLDEVLAEVK